MDARTALKGSVKFIATFAVLFAAASVILAPIGLLNSLALESTKAFLWAAGISAGAAGYSGGFPLLAVQGFPYLVQINDLCAAKIELAVLLGIVFASADRSVRQRVCGFFAGAFIALLFNPVRISLSVVFFNPLIHDVLFRAMLVLVIVSYYALWYEWLSAPRPAPKAPRAGKGRGRSAHVF
ncbi:MAG: hypothetical protein NTY90_03655 [Candidatus Micrarchaeota archaeon]|nr:hypothetical protein [Candidatus Micrarchaeota archaeon]